MFSVVVRKFTSGSTSALRMHRSTVSESGALPATIGKHCLKSPEKTTTQTPTKRLVWNTFCLSHQGLSHQVINAANDRKRRHGDFTPEDDIAILKSIHLPHPEALLALPPKPHVHVLLLLLQYQHHRHHVERPCCTY